jgi:hypothetical protein
MRANVERWGIHTYFAGQVLLFTQDGFVAIQLCTQFGNIISNNLFIGFLPYEPNASACVKHLGVRKVEKKE